MRTFLLIVAALAGCGGGNKASSDAAIDAPADAPIDMMPLALDCPTYCTQIEQHCTNANLQYPAMEPSSTVDPCIRACAAFEPPTGKTTDTTGNTLGCRINHAAAAATMPAVECPRAGPAGDAISPTPGFCSGGDACKSFCALEIMACGSLDMPLPGNPRDISNNVLYQYQNLADCMDQCLTSFDKQHSYSTTALGDSLACRLGAAVTAAISLDQAKVFCAYTGPTPIEHCTGTASP
jgi:hypothetical protein